ncbi:hypothetical protein I7641_02745 [Mycoplasma mycoides subsp. capri]|nr:hypothetical protein [Mycoplasma mycoides]QVK05738.1 hypothetical protein I7641_02745 [Mycoplasma mycoides subsp. capri]
MSSKNNTKTNRIQLLNILLFKNLLPFEFEKLQNNNGVVYEILHKNKYEYYINWAREHLKYRLKEVDHNIECISNELITNGYIHQFIVRELIKVTAIYDSYNEKFDYDHQINENSNIPLTQRDEEKVNVLTRLKKQNLAQARVRYYDEYWNHIIEEKLTYKEFWDKFVDDKLQNKLNNLRLYMERELFNYKSMKSRIVDAIYECSDNKISITTLLNIIDWENSNSNDAKKWFNNIKLNNDLTKWNLIKKLFRFGIISENYEKYIGYID